MDHVHYRQVHNDITAEPGQPGEITDPAVARADLAHGAAGRAFGVDNRCADGVVTIAESRGEAAPCTDWSVQIGGPDQIRRAQVDVLRVTRRPFKEDRGSRVEG